MIDADRVKYWMSVGAQPSDTVHNMLISLGILTGKKINVLPKFVEPQKEETAPVEEAAPAPAAEEAPAVAEEAAPEAAAEEAPATEETPAA